MLCGKQHLNKWDGINMFDSDEEWERGLIREYIYSLDKAEEFIAFIAILPPNILKEYAKKLTLEWHMNSSSIVHEELKTMIDEFCEEHPYIKRVSFEPSKEPRQEEKETKLEEFTEADILEASKLFNIKLTIS